MVRAKTVNPLWNYYKCSDDKWLYFGHLQPDRYWPAFCEALGIEQLINDLRFNNMNLREEHAGELVAILDRIIATKTREQWLKICKDADLIYSPVNTIGDLLNDPQLPANDYITNFDHPSLGKIKVVGSPVQFSEAPTSVKRPAPAYAQHTEEILLEIGGYSWKEITELKNREVI